MAPYSEIAAREAIPGLAASLIQRLSWVLNTAARLVFRTKRSEHITLLISPH